MLHAQTALLRGARSSCIQQNAQTSRVQTICCLPSRHRAPCFIRCAEVVARMPHLRTFQSAHCRRAPALATLSCVDALSNAISTGMMQLSSILSAMIKIILNRKTRVFKTKFMLFHFRQRSGSSAGCRDVVAHTFDAGFSSPDQPQSTIGSSWMDMPSAEGADLGPVEVFPRRGERNPYK